MDYLIREMKPNEYSRLVDFLYLAIFVPEGQDPPPESIINDPDLQIYIADFGKTDDHALVAESNGRLIGTVWVRIMKDYGHIDEKIPSLAISVLEDYRGLGIGSDLMRKMLKRLRSEGYPGVSLSVQKENRAASWYMDFGFKIWKENAEEYILHFPFINTFKSTSS